MPLEDIRSRIANAIAHEQRTAAFSRRLETAASAQGLSLGADQIRQTLSAVRAYVENVPALLEGTSSAIQEAKQDRLLPVLQSAENAFLAAPGIPDELGLAGLVDNAYLAYGIVLGLPGADAPPEFMEFHRTIRGLIGEPLATQLDEMIAACLRLPETSTAEGPAAAPDLAGVVPGPSAPQPFRTMNPPRVVPVRSAPVQGPAPPRGREGPGSLDPGFGRGGVVVTRLQDATVQGMAVYADGRVVVAGTSKNDNGDTGITVARYLPDGKLDASLASTGCVRLDLDKGQDVASRGIAVQPDGRIVVAGFADPPRDEVGRWEELAVGRLTPDGGLDTSFGHGGWVQLRSFIASRPEALALQPDGKVLLAGSVTGQSGPSFAVLRLTPQGGLDPAFGDAGMSTFGEASASAILVQEDGKIVAAGSVNGKLHAVRLTPGGRLDAGFGDGGRLSFDLGGSDLAIGSIATDPEGRILVAGGLRDPHPKYLLLRLRPDGALDPDFADGGVLAGEFAFPDPDDPQGFRSGASWALGVAVQPDGAVLLAGRVVLSQRSIGYVSIGSGGGEAVARNTAFVVARFTRDGTLDSSFGERGTAVTDLGEDEDEARAVAVHPRGGIVAAGRSEGHGFAVVRYLASSGVRVEGEAAVPAGPEASTAPSESGDGRLDPSFANGGAAFVDFGIPATAQALVVDAEGRILVAGQAASAEGGIDVALARLEADGTLDATFGAGGQTLVGVSGRDVAHALAVQSDGGIVVAGEARGGSEEGTDFLLMRLDARGTVDPGFGDGGVVLTDFFGGSDDRAYALALQPDGKIVAAGYSTLRGPPTKEVFAIARYGPDGALDPGFGAGGIVVPPFPSDFARARAVCVQPDGRIVAAGPVHSGRGATPYDFAVVRLLSNGALDESFGDRGIAIVDLPGTDDTAHAIAVQADGSLVVAGEAVDEATDLLHFLIVRLDAAGHLDPGFNETGGVLLEDFRGGAYGIAVPPDGTVLAAGFARATGEDGASKERVALVRLTRDGKLDPAFGDRGVATVGLGGERDRASAVSLQADGRIVVGATSVSGGDSSIAVVRLINVADAGTEGEG